MGTTRLAEILRKFWPKIGETLWAIKVQIQPICPAEWRTPSPWITVGCGFALPSDYRALVYRDVRCPDRRTIARLGGDSEWQGHAHRRADRLRQDARGVPDRPRRSRPRRRGRAAARR